MGVYREENCQLLGISTRERNGKEVMYAEVVGLGWSVTVPVLDEGAAKNWPKSKWGAAVIECRIRPAVQDFTNKKTGEKDSFSVGKPELGAMLDFIPAK